MYLRGSWFQKSRGSRSIYFICDFRPILLDITAFPV
jgi:hypothetical protein